jgi:hypothetical protein
MAWPRHAVSSEPLIYSGGGLFYPALHALVSEVTTPILLFLWQRMTSPPKRVATPPEVYSPFLLQR